MADADRTDADPNTGTSRPYDPWTWYGPGYQAACNTYPTAHSLVAHRDYPTAPYPYRPWGSEPPTVRTNLRVQPGTSVSVGLDEEDHSGSSDTDTEAVYSYRVKVINPKKKSEFTIWELHNLHGKFTSIGELKEKLMVELGNEVPRTVEFNIGYYFGKQSAKRWLVTQKDLESMYETGKTTIVLWCDGRTPDRQDSDCERPCKRKAPIDVPPTTKRKQVELDVDELVSDLKEKHKQYSLLQLRLWARMITSGNHESTDEPPNLPAITGVDPKKPKKATLNEAIILAVSSLANAIRPTEIAQAGSCNAVVISDAHTPSKTNSTYTSRPIGLSPGKITEIRYKKIQELKELQKLVEQNILTDEEFAEQKSLVLNSLCKLTD